MVGSDHFDGSKTFNLTAFLSDLWTSVFKLKGEATDRTVHSLCPEIDCMISYYLKNAGWAFVGLLVAGAIAAVLIQFEETWLWSIVDPVAGTKIEDWIDAYQLGAWYSLLTASMMSILWFGYSLIDSGRDGDGRSTWIAFLATAVFVSMSVCYVSFAGAQSGDRFGYAAVAVNAVLVFWPATVFCSPSAHRYAPLGARALRGRLMVF
jgi:hypothetical protein